MNFAFKFIFLIIFIIFSTSSTSTLAKRAAIIIDYDKTMIRLELDDNRLEVD